jgi:ADP-ribose pyrophosphatase
MKKIPDNAKLVFKGVLHDVYQWEQELFDGSFATFEAIKRKDAVTVVAVTPEGKIVMNNEEQPAHLPFIALPGGVMEVGESELTNAQRELKEETGYESDVWSSWFISDILGSAKVDWNNHFYIAKKCTKTSMQHVDAGEKITNFLVSFEEFLEMRHDPKFRNKDLIPILEKAANSEEEKQKLKDLLGITT